MAESVAAEATLSFYRLVTSFLVKRKATPQINKGNTF